MDLSGLPPIENPGTIAILKSKWYPQVVEKLATTCETVLRDYGYQDIEQHTLPGSLELPLAARDLLSEDVEQRIDAVICFGVIVKGRNSAF